MNNFINPATSGMVRPTLTESKIDTLMVVDSCAQIPISRFSISGAHTHWVGSTDTPSHATKELKMR